MKVTSLGGHTKLFMLGFPLYLKCFFKVPLQMPLDVPGGGALGGGT